MTSIVQTEPFYSSSYRLNLQGWITVKGWNSDK